MKKRALSILFMTVLFIGSFYVVESYAWLIFHKPEYKGKIIDAETQEPIEDVVVVAVYNTHTIIGGPAGGYSSVVKVKETLTDKTGEFLIPSYTTIMSPNSKEYYTEFIIYKPGYASYPNYKRRIVPFKFCGPEYLFTKEVGSIGLIKNGTKSVNITYGIAKLPKLNAWEERRRAVPSRPVDTTSKELPLLNEIIKNEDEWIWKNKGWER
jgi:hypothetical protein